MSVTDRVAKETYRGVWAILRTWFRVPEHAPTLPPPPGGSVTAFQPAPGFLQYLKFQFWIVLFAFDGVVLLAWIVITAASPTVGAWLAVPALIIAVVPDIIAYVAIHLRYDTTWYVMSDRSLRLRHGIWVINEMTFTFENVQNVSVQQGPVQRYFGIASVVVQTAGGGSGGPHGTTNSSHEGRLDGIANAEGLRDIILARVNASRSAGLGDERHGHVDHDDLPRRFGPAHVATLREIRDVIRAHAVHA